MGHVAIAGDSMICKTGGSDEVGSAYWNCYTCDKAGGCFNLFAKADLSMPKQMTSYLKRQLLKFKHRKGCAASRSKTVVMVQR
jgi:hypothetical protein